MEEDIKVLEEHLEHYHNILNSLHVDKLESFEVEQAIENLIKGYKKLEEKYKRLSIEAQATAFDDENKDTEGLLRVLLKQGEITLDEKGYYQREAFDWEKNMYMLGLMKKREKCFYIPDDECLDEYTKQLENQSQEYNEIKEIFKKYMCFPNDTMYDGCCKMQDEIDELKEKNKELDSENIRIRATLNEVTKNYISKDKIREIFDNYSQSSLMENNTFLEFKKELLEERN